MDRVSTEQEAISYPITKLAEHCGELFGVSRCSFVGATRELTGEYTIPQMKEIISEWMKKEVK